MGVPLSLWDTYPRLGSSYAIFFLYVPTPDSLK